jgi:hypothetical protein
MPADTQQQWQGQAGSDGSGVNTGAFRVVCLCSSLATVVFPAPCRQYPKRLYHILCSTWDTNTAELQGGELMQVTRLFGCILSLNDSCKL